MLSSETLTRLKNLFLDSSQEVDSRGNRKVSNPWKIPLVRELLSRPLQDLGLKTDICFGDNFYKHNYEYLIHTDFRSDEGESVNVVIPIWQKKPGAQHMVLFDQWWPGDGRTWSWRSAKKYEPNLGLPGRPYDYPEVVGLTDKPIGEGLFSYLENIPHMPREYFFGLSGQAHIWSPGQVLVFDSRQLHCTGTFNVEEKLGLLLRFSKN